MTATVTEGRTRRSPRRGRGDRGTTSVTVLMVPFVLVGTMLVVQFGLAMYARQVVSGAAQDGAAQGALVGSSPQVGLATTDQLVAQAGGHLLSNYSSSHTSGADVVTISASADVVKLLPVFPTITVRAVGSAPVEQFSAAQP